MTVAAVAQSAEVNTTKGKVKVVSKKPKVTKELQTKIDQYIEKNRKKNELEKELKVLRAEIEPFMNENDLMALPGVSLIGSIVLQSVERVSPTNKYTYYDPTVIIADLPMELARKCLVEVVDREIVEALNKLGEIPKSVLDKAKLAKTTYNFTVK